jgi:hypothetical protein
MNVSLRGSPGPSRQVTRRRSRHPVPADAALYVYGIVPADVSVPDDLHGISDAHIRVVTHGSVAALTSQLQLSRRLGTAADLRAHSRVIEAIFQSCPVLPMRFGGALENADAVVGELLEPHSDSFADALQRIRDHEQVVLRGRYLDGIAYAEVLAEDKQIARMSAWLREREAETHRLEAVQLGALVARALERKQQADMKFMRDLLEPGATAVAERVPASPEVAVDAAFLVRRRDRLAFERAAEDLGRRWVSRVRLRLVGPLPAYDFAHTPEMEQWACSVG